VTAGNFEAEKLKKSFANDCITDDIMLFFSLALCLLTVNQSIKHNTTNVLHREGSKLVKIRLRRVGAKKKPSYRVVVADSRAPRDGVFIEILGHYDPLTDPETVVINEEKALHWLSQGAQPTATTARLLSKTGIMEKFNSARRNHERSN